MVRRVGDGGRVTNIDGVFVEKRGLGKGRGGEVMRGGV